jgi:adenylate cyclase
MRLRLSKPVLATALGALLVAALGWIFLALQIGHTLAHISYDLPFRFRSIVATPELAIVLMDEKSARVLKQPINAEWNRKHHADLVRALTAAGARAILFDVIFHTPSADPAIDADFAAAIRAHGRVFLGAALEPVDQRGVVGEAVRDPLPILREAAAGWGVVHLRPIDPDYGVRRISSGTEDVPGATWRLAHSLGAPIPGKPEDPPVERWLNYYRPAGTLPSASFSEVLQSGSLPPEFFKDRIVFVGARMAVGSLDHKKDEFRTPYTRWGHPFASGVEIHAQALRNLLHGEWLTRAPVALEIWLALAFAIGITALLSWLRPVRAVIAAIVIAAAIAIAAISAATFTRVWWDWLVPVAVQIPVALVWSLGANYTLETRRRKEIRRAFSLYLSPHMADEIADSKFDLTPGGKNVVATMLFTDLKGFTELAEQFPEPEQVARVLIDYFNNTTQHILDNKGTIIKYVGDAVYATWGAPLADADHALHAVQAAWMMHQSSKFNVQGHELITRIGVNTGKAFAGNLGSNFRFDYTLTGDAVNLASRLEGLNKMLGTGVLLGEATWHAVKDKFAARSVGKFRVKGKHDAVEIYELLGPSISPVMQAAMDTFSQALEAFRKGDFLAARSLFERTKVHRGPGGGTDGPSDYFLNYIATFEKNGPPTNWDGTIHLETK